LIYSCRSISTGFLNAALRLIEYTVTTTSRDIKVSDIIKGNAPMVIFPLKWLSQFRATRYTTGQEIKVPDRTGQIISNID